MKGNVARPATMLSVFVALLLTAFAAPASASTGFEADGYPANLDGSGTIQWVGSSEQFCSSSSLLEGSLSGPSPRLTTTAVADFCKNDQVEMNGCNFYFAPETYGPGEFGVGPAGCGPILITQKPDPYPCLFVYPQSAPGVQTMNFETTEAESGKDALEIDVSAELEYEHCISEEKGYVDVEGAWTVTAADQEDNPVGVRLSEEIELEPSLGADAYPASVSGTGFDELVMKHGTFSCASTSLEASLESATTKVNDVDAGFSGCVFDLYSEGETEFEAFVSMNSCHFTLGVEDAGPPFGGELGVACDTPGDAIEFKVFALEKVRPCLKLTSQSGLSGVSLANLDGWAVGLDAGIEGVEYELAGICGSGVQTDGVLSGESTLMAEDESENVIGMYVFGEGS